MSSMLSLTCEVATAPAENASAEAEGPKVSESDRTVRWLKAESRIGVTVARIVLI